MRRIVAFASWALVLILVNIVGNTLIPWELTAQQSFLMTFGVSIILIGTNLKHFLVSVPEVTGLVTINLFTGKLIPYGTGVHFKFPWEQVKEGNFINLRLVTVPFDETFPALDGPRMVVKGSLQYLPVLSLLPRYIAVDKTTIDNGLTDVAKSVLSRIISPLQSNAVKTEQRDIENQLRSAFENGEGLLEDLNIIDTDDQDHPETLEELYGIDLKLVSLSDVDYEKDFQDARSAEAIAEKYRKIAAKIKRERPDISDKDAMNLALVSARVVTKTITEVEGDGLNALGALYLSGEAKKGGKK